MADASRLKELKALFDDGLLAADVYLEAQRAVAMALAGVAAESPFYPARKAVADPLYAAAAAGILSAGEADETLFRAEPYASPLGGMFGHVGSWEAAEEASPLESTYIKGACLGEGSFGQVYAAKLQPHGEQSEGAAAARRSKARRHGAHHDVFDDQCFALKFLELHDMAEATDAAMETLRMVRCEHPNIVGVREQFFHNRYSELTPHERLTKSPLQLVIVLEQCHGDLCDKIGRGWCGKGWAEDDVHEDAKLRILLQIASAVQCIHAHGLIHRDLKPENIFMHDDGSVKVGDLGLATRDRSCDKDGAGTSGYIAPELWKYCGSQFTEEEAEDYNHKVDVWSIGMILIDMVCAKAFADADAGSAAYQLALESEITTINAEEDEGGDDWDVANVFIRDPEASMALLMGHENIRDSEFVSAALRLCLPVSPDARGECADILKALEPWAAKASAAAS